MKENFISSVDVSRIPKMPDERGILEYIPGKARITIVRFNRRTRERKTRRYVTRVGRARIFDFRRRPDNLT